MIDFTTAMPLPDAVEQISERTPLGSTLSSAEWEAMPAEVRRRAFFAARVENERILAEMKRRIEQRIRVERDKRADGSEGAYMDRGRFIEEMRLELEKAGYKRGAGVKKDSLQDLKSSRRLGLIWDMNLAQAEGYASWKTGMDKDLLRAVPAQELVRKQRRTVEREWPQRWREAGGKFYGEPTADYPNAPGRMIALKTDPIWTVINRFKVPWEPYDWGSGMGTRNVRRREAKALGVIRPDDAEQIPDESPFNKNYEMSVKGLDPIRRAKLEEDFDGEVEISGETARLLPPDEMGKGKPGKVARPIFKRRDQPAAEGGNAVLTEVVVVPGGVLDRTAKREARRAIELASGIHVDGVLPPPVVLIESPDPGVGGDYRATTDASVPPTVRVSPQALNPGWAVLHELGHLLDNWGLHTPQPGQPYASTGQVELGPLMQAITTSATFRRILERARAAKNGYWVTPQELFARAYAQFIAVKSGDRKLMAELETIRGGSREEFGIWKDSQWDDEDFAPILDEMETLFTNRGWIPAQ